MTAWLDIIGIGEDGVDGLSTAARETLAAAEVILGGDRHHTLSNNATAERVSWPSPFNAMIETIRSMKGRRAVVLVTGDPLWYSVGARILKDIPASEIRFHPQLSAFQWATARMGWSLADVETLTVHGRATEQILPYLAPGQRLIILTRDRTTPPDLAAMLTKRGYGDSTFTVLGALGGPDETRIADTASNWTATAPDFHTLCIECVLNAGTPVFPKGPGLPDQAFEHDGKMTKQEVRAVTLAKLMPVRGGMLWDVGAGCGSIGIEWMRAARDAQAIAIEPLADRRAMIARNAQNLGVPKLTILNGTAPHALTNLQTPDAIFIGGGLSEDVVNTCRAALPAHGRLVANAVTLESEALLLDLHKRLGGTLTKLSIARAIPVGPYRGWKPFMPVTQWSMT